MVLETHMKLCITEPVKKILKFPKNWENGQKRFGHKFFPNLVYNEDLYYLLYSCTNLIFEKNLILEIWAKTLLACQIVGFLNQVYL